MAIKVQVPKAERMFRAEAQAMSLRSLQSRGGFGWALRSLISGGCGV